jgi:hypothetical protein
MTALSGWQGIAVAGLIGMAVWALRFVIADFVLDRFGDVLSDRLRRWDQRQPDGT